MNYKWVFEAIERLETPAQSQEQEDSEQLADNVENININGSPDKNTS